MFAFLQCCLGKLFWNSRLQLSSPVNHQRSVKVIQQHKERQNILCCSSWIWFFFFFSVQTWLQILENSIKKISQINIVSPNSDKFILIKWGSIEFFILKHDLWGNYSYLSFQMFLEGTIIMSVIYFTSVFWNCVLCIYFLIFWRWQHP